MSDISKHPFDTEATQAEIDEYMRIASVPGAPQEFLHNWEAEHGYIAKRDPGDLNYHEVVQTPAPTPKFSIKIGNETFYGNSPEELSANSQDAIVKQIEAGNAARAAAGDVVARNPNGTFAKQPSATDGLDRITNGLVTNALQEELGISPEELQESVMYTRQDRKDVASWAKATQDFLKVSPDYPGGEDLKNRMSKRVIELGLVDSPSAASFRKAYDSLVAEDNLAESLQKVTDPQQMRELLGITGREQDRLRNGWK